jgi:hypothetical protein
VSVDDGRSFVRPPHFRYIVVFFLPADLWCCRYNAHTSAGDVLWAGVPIVTLPGELMVTRGASSLLISGGGAMTVARTFEEYEDLVCRP